MRSARSWTHTIATGAVVALLVACEPVTGAVDPAPASEPEAVAQVEAPELLSVTDLKDGDSFVASDGVEYRLGLVNTPEASEQCGSDARRFTGDFLSDGFVVEAYARDTHGRTVAEVLDTDGASLNVALAESGLADDRYLDEFRHENPELAGRLDTAFSDADRPSCRQPEPAASPQPLVQQPSSADCHPSYSPCIPVVGDLDCPEIEHPVSVTGPDAYRLDRDGDGTGCD